LGSPGEDISELLAQARAGAGAAGPQPAGPSDAATAGPPAPRLLPGDQLKPLSQMRKTIARRLVDSKTTAPHFYLTAEVDVDAALELRDRLVETGEARVSMNDLVLKASALALRKVPQANASFAGDAVVQHARVHVGLAVAVEDGLVTPVIRDADDKPLGQIGSEAHELAARARDRKLRLDEMTGGTFSVSNLGGYGIDHFAAIINPPEAAILAVGRVRKEPVVREGKITVGHRMALTLSCDHRVIDGATGARLLQAIVALLEQPLPIASGR
jgi:pyruvate dehydrogenase E2 component (dihydrolipoamide acetyltransferase)